MKKEVFTLGEVLSVTTGRLLCPIGGLYRILNYLTGESLFTHQLGRAMDACRPYVLEMFPPLAEVDASGVNKDNWFSWLHDQTRKYGDVFLIAPMQEGRYLPKNPIEELQEMVADPFYRCPSRVV